MESPLIVVCGLMLARESVVWLRDGKVTGTPLKAPWLSAEKLVAVCELADPDPEAGDDAEPEEKAGMDTESGSCSGKINTELLILRFDCNLGGLRLTLLAVVEVTPSQAQGSAEAEAWPLDVTAEPLTLTAPLTYDEG